MKNILILVLLMCVLLVGCGKSQPSTVEPSNTAQNNEVVEQEEHKVEVITSDSVTNKSEILAQKFINELGLDASVAEDNSKLLEKLDIDVNINNEFSNIGTEENKILTLTTKYGSYYWMNLDEFGYILTIRKESSVGPIIYVEDSNIGTTLDDENILPYSFLAIGESLTFGGIFINDKAEIPSSKYIGGDIVFGTEEIDHGIEWIKLDNNLYISKNNVLNDISWNELNNQGYIDGRVFDIKGLKCRIRVMTGGNLENDDDISKNDTNEWDYYISAKEYDLDYTRASWCTELVVNQFGDKTAVIRGLQYNSYWGIENTDKDKEIGFRPVLEFIQ